MIDLSVLVCSIHTRHDNFALTLQKELWCQLASLATIDQDRVEIMVLTDNKVMSIGRKRNTLADAATGRYIQFIDDDDRIESDMLATVLAATATDADVLAFQASVRIDGGVPRICKYSKEFGHDYNTQDEYRRIPNHIPAVRRELACRARWGDVSYGEDRDYSQRLLPLLATEHQINRVLYHYDYNRRTSESRR